MENNQIVKHETAKTIGQYLTQETVSHSIAQVLGKKKEQFVASIISLVNTNEALKSAEPNSVVNAALTAAALDLPINQNLGFAYIIAYNDRKSGKVYAQYQMGYKGFIQLAQRSGQFATLNAGDVRKGELVGKDQLTGEYKFNWNIDEGARLNAPIIGYFAHFELLNGFRKTLYMSNEELKVHGQKYSQTFKKGFGKWADDFDAMARKTVIKLLLARYAPLSSDMQKAQMADQAIIHAEGNYEYVDHEKVTPEQIANDKEKSRIEKFISEARTTTELEQVEDKLDHYGLRDTFENKLEELEMVNVEVKGETTEEKPKEDLQEKIKNSKFAPKKVQASLTADEIEKEFNG